MTFDPDSLRILVAAGTGTYYYDGFADDLWSLDLSPAPTWRRLISDSPYYYSATYRPQGLLTYDRGRHQAVLAQGYGAYGSTPSTRVRVARPGRDTLWTPVSASGPAPPDFSQPAGVFDPASGRLLVQGDLYGDVSSSSADERTFALTFLSPVLAVPGGTASDGATLEAWPNPARGEFRLRWSAAGNAPVQVEVFDVSGRRIASRTVPAGQGEVRIGTSRTPLPAGLYLVRARSAGVALTRRVLVVD